MNTLTLAQFECCRQDLDDAVSLGAKLVLVDGLSIGNAAKTAGVSSRRVLGASERIKQRYAEICAANPWGTESTRAICTASTVLEVIAALPSLAQRQDSTREQLQDLMRVANKLGMYDAADAIKLSLQN